MKPIWLIETGLWKDENVARMIPLLRELGCVVHAEPYTCGGGTEFEIVGTEQPVVFYGSLNTAEYLCVLRRNWIPLNWFDAATFSCRSYYAHWGKYLLQENYGFYPFAELSRLKTRLYRSIGKDGMIFIRPDENDKSFTGCLVPEDNFARWHEETRTDGVAAAALVVVSSPVRIEAEWRFVIADRRVVAGSGYKGGGKLENADEYQSKATLLAEKISAEPWQPRAIYCADVAYCGADRYRLVEIGNVNSAGLYRCELLPVIEAMNAIAERDFRYWKGKTGGR